MRCIPEAVPSQSDGAWWRRPWAVALVPLVCVTLVGCPNRAAGPRSASAAGMGGAEDEATGNNGAGGGTTTAPGPVDLGAGVVNARQVGGLATASGQRVRAGALIRSGELSQVACDRLQALGVVTVVDLRDATDAGANPDATCVNEASRYFLADLPKILPPTAEAYLQTLDATEPKLDAIFTELTREGALPAVIHCVIGRDRASLTMALVLLGLGVSRADVERDFVENHDTPGYTSAEWMSGVFARIEAAGGVEAYLAAHGVTAEDLARLRAQALE